MLFTKKSKSLKKLNLKSMPTKIKLEFDKLETKKKKALKNLLDFENSSKYGFELRKKNYSDLYELDNTLYPLTSQILSVIYPKPKLPNYSPIFGEFSDIHEEVNVFKKNGYITSKYKIPDSTLEQIKSSISNFTFRSRGANAEEYQGSELLYWLNCKQPTVKEGTTYWLSDQNMAAQSSIISKLAFDPYILSIVSEYLGCEPIHVQSNVWFSFNSNADSKILSKNAQLFHQDKDFVKFVKVFIYLNDVDDNNGPHCYIEKSHKDELFKKGVPLSGRVSDEDISSYFSPKRIKFLKGKAGTFAFGDTSCTHKGMPVKDGGRLLLQLEYASTLYMRPYMPFESLSLEAQENFNRLQLSTDRLIQDYNTNARIAFNKYSNRPSNIIRTRIKPLVRKVKNKIK